ncbi:response regulator transcription factor [Streptomyces sp. NPDC059134]|uniref:response regulator transcription factor n=1 Tax=Streptomyces sp. NPDC059134 TaxID=3346738 RepID=UPI00368CD8BF
MVAEDDAKQAELVRRYLEHEGYAVTVVEDGRAALEGVRHRAPDLLVLDVMMPRTDGLDVVRILRAEGREVPVLMLTARSTEDDLLLGLDLGADDYMTKPFSPRELMARVRTLLRRHRRSGGSPDAGSASGSGSGSGSGLGSGSGSGSGSLSGPDAGSGSRSDSRSGSAPVRARVPVPAPAAVPGDEVLSVGTLRIDPARHEVSVGDTPVVCTPGEFRILAAMAAEPDRVFTRQRLLEELHGFATYISGRTVDVHVMHLRKKIERSPRRPTRLLTVFGVGYKLTDPAKDGRHAPS